MSTGPEQYTLAEGLEISRVVTGLWQIADMERDGNSLDPEQGADHLQAYFDEGFSTFDMADHYGSAEIIAGRLLKRHSPNTGERPLAFTKWCPEPGRDDRGSAVRAGVEERLRTPRRRAPRHAPSPLVDV